MKPQEIANSLWSFAQLARSSGPEARAALEAAVVRVGFGMNAQDVAILFWAFATLGWELSSEVRATL
jgi:hypothetical protein